jgi:hypothetical protein
MVVDRDPASGPFANLSERDKLILRQAQEQGLAVPPADAARIDAVARARPQADGQRDEDYEIDVLNRLRLEHPPDLVPAEPVVRLFLARRRALRGY